MSIKRILSLLLMVFVKAAIGNKTTASDCYMGSLCVSKGWMIGINVIIVLVFIGLIGGVVVIICGVRLRRKRRSIAERLIDRNKSKARHRYAPIAEHPPGLSYSASVPSSMADTSSNQQQAPSSESEDSQSYQSLRNLSEEENLSKSMMLPSSLNSEVSDDDSSQQPTDPELSSKGVFEKSETPSDG